MGTMGVMGRPAAAWQHGSVSLRPPVCPSARTTAIRLQTPRGRGGREFKKGIFLYSSLIHFTFPVTNPASLFSLSLARAPRFRDSHFIIMTCICYLATVNFNLDEPVRNGRQSKRPKDNTKKGFSSFFSSFFCAYETSSDRSLNFIVLSVPPTKLYQPGCLTICCQISF